MKPIIGIFGQVDKEGKHVLLYDYAAAIREAGGIGMIFTYTECAKDIEAAIAVCDGICFTGGVDVDPAHYGEEVIPECGEIHPMRDKLELLAVPAVIASGKPILGICRGAQVLNVALGGSLYQDLRSQTKTEMNHSQTERYEYSHEINVEESTPLYRLSGAGRIKINSFHHQAIKRLGRNLVPMAYADDGTVEAVYADGEQYVRLYQWHPERLVRFDETARRIFTDFVRASSENKIIK